MSPEAGQAWFRVGVFLTLVSLLVLPFQPRDSAEFVVTVLALLSGLLLLALVAWLVRRSG